MTARALCSVLGRGRRAALGLAVCAALAACDTSAPPSGLFDATVSGSGVRYALVGEAMVVESVDGSEITVTLRDRGQLDRVVTITLDAPARAPMPVGDLVRLGYTSHDTAFVARGGEVRLERVGPEAVAGTFRANLDLASGAATVFAIEGRFDAGPAPRR